MPSASSPIDTNLLTAVTAELSERKATTIFCYDVREQLPYAEYIIIASATSSTHTRALVRYLVSLLKERGLVPGNRNRSRENNAWVVLDYGDLIIHIMEQDAREHYKLDEMLNNAAILPD
jgi:ribosome-associated protein